MNLLISLNLYKFTKKGNLCMEDLYTRLTRLLEKKGSNPYQLAKATGIYSGFITDLKMGRQKSMSSKKAAKVAEYLGVSVDYLLYGKESEAPPVASDDDLKAAFFGGGSDLTPEEIDSLWEETKNFIEFRKAQMRKK